jgi:hypothetical protein
VLINIAKLITASNEVLDLLVHPGENSTYNLQFRAPQFRCTVSQHNSTIPMEYGEVDSGQYRGPYLRYLAFSSTFSTPASPTPMQAESLLYSASQYSLHSIIEKRSLNNTSCKPYSMLYDVTISFPRGVRTIEHNISDSKVLPIPKDVLDENVPKNWPPGLYLSTYAEPQALEEWRQRALALVPVFNEWAILDALGTVLDVAWYSGAPGYSEGCIQKYAFENGTTIHVCNGHEMPGLVNNSIMCKSRVPRCLLILTIR